MFSVCVLVVVLVVFVLTAIGFGVLFILFWLLLFGVGFVGLLFCGLVGLFRLDLFWFDAWLIVCGPVYLRVCPRVCGFACV